MELSSHEGEIPIPINSSYGGGHGHMIRHDHQTAATHHNHNIIPTNSTNPQMPSISANNGVPIPTPISSTALELEDQNHNIIVPFKKGAVKYRECLKNHAAAMGGNATDGCGEFMPSGEEGTLEALTCSACNCHRNFHRKEVEGESNSSPCDNYFHTTSRNISGRKVIVGHHHHKNVFGYPAAAAGTLITPRGAPPPPPPPPHLHHMIMSYNMGSFASESDEQEDGGGSGGVVLRPVPHQMVKKRFRTKFTQEQKDKMLDFAERVGWKIQKQEEAVVQQFCQEIGVRRRVLKVWMHNNKHNLAKKNPSSSSNVQNPV